MLNTNTPHTARIDVHSHAYSTNDELVDRFLEHVLLLTPGELELVVETWREGQRADGGPGTRAAWVAAEDAAIETLVRTARGERAWRVQDRVHATFQRATAWRPRGFGALRSSVTAEYLVGTAAMALLVADVLSARHLARLYAPFLASVPLTELERAVPRARAANDA